MKWMEAGVFMLGLGVLIISGIEALKYVDQKSRRIPCGRPAGTYEVDMDDYF